MSQTELHTLIALRLEDMAEQTNILYSQGDYAEAELLRDEGLELAGACDAGETFMFMSDLSEV
jgi:hypothetical protein